MTDSKENPLVKNVAGKNGRTVDQDSELPVQRKQPKNSPNATQQSFGSKKESTGQQSSKEKGPSMANMMQRTFNRRSPVK